MFLIKCFLENLKQYLTLAENFGEKMLLDFTLNEVV
jgi:hypothetical protein